jgi:hypothetical protein
LLGFADNIRGHWRIVLDVENCCVIHEVSPEGFDETNGVIRKAEPSPAKEGDSEGAS